jgi:hypothetical protein
LLAPAFRAVRRQSQEAAVCDADEDLHAGGECDAAPVGAYRRRERFDGELAEQLAGGLVAAVTLGCRGPTPARQFLGYGEPIRIGVAIMPNDETVRHLQTMDELDFKGWNQADWNGVFANCHTDDVLVDVHGQPQTHGIQEHIDAMKALVETTGGAPIQVASHPISFGSGEWTCVVGEFEGGGRMVTVAKWRDGAIAEEYIWM